MLWLALGYMALGAVRGELFFLILGALLGIGWGVVMPVLNALMFDISTPQLRAFNSNMGLQMFQGGFFIGPLLGGLVLAHWGFEHLFFMCTLFSLLAAFLALRLRRLKQL